MGSISARPLPDCRTVERESRLPGARIPAPVHILVDISSHGFGHLAITAPVIAALHHRQPALRLTIRSGLPEARLRQRIPLNFELIPAATDFGYVMRDALSIDRAASAAAYRRAHADWPARVAAEAEFLAGRHPDLILSNVSYLPLAGAARAGIPAAALCSLNWADLFAHFYIGESWAISIHAEILAAYRSAQVFLRTEPGMPMSGLGNVAAVGPIASRGQRRDLCQGNGVRTILIALGGIAHRLPVEDWPRLPGVRWLVPADWQVRHPDAQPFEPLGLGFTDLLASMDAVLTKPGYGTFTEAAVNGIPVLYQRREDWPEQDCLIEWLHRNACCREVAGHRLQNGDLAADLAALWRQPPRLPAVANGADEAAACLLALAQPPKADNRRA